MVVTSPPTCRRSSSVCRQQSHFGLPAEVADKYDVDVTMDGGGVAGQAGALRLGIARALVELDGERRPIMKKSGFLTRDDRKKESKKYGLKKARKAGQYSKR
jgi:small subunit ribosomal protein S9